MDEIDDLAKQARAQLESSDHLLKHAFIAYLDSKWDLKLKLNIESTLK